MKQIQTTLELSEYVYDLLDAGNALYPTNKYTVYIPTKGRAGSVKTLDVIKGLNYKLVVEPQDYDDYCKIYPVANVVKMDKNDQGLAYARNYIKKYSRSVNEEKHWQLDDDIECFLIRKRNTTKNVITNPVLCFSVVEHCMDMFSNVAVCGISANAYAFSKNYAVQINRLAYQCILVNNSVDIDWAMSPTEDWHYTFSVLEAGYCTLAFHHIMQQSAPTMQNSGGCTGIEYSGDKRKIAYEAFIKQWPNRFRVKEYPGSPKPWRLQPMRRFFNDYKQILVAKDSLDNL